MTRGVQCQHDGSSRRLAWDLGLQSLTTRHPIQMRWPIFTFSEFTLEMLRIGCVEEWSSEELNQVCVAYDCPRLIRGKSGGFLC
jgi:hypothetical protein